MLGLSLRQLEYFVECVDLGSVARAAERLNVSQPTVSAAISKLEDHLGVTLLLRHHAQGVSPTGSANQILPLARSILAGAADLQKRAQQAGTALSGTLRLGSFSTLSPSILPKLIKRLQAEHPEIRLEVSEGTQKTLVDELVQGRLDAALLYDLDLPASLRCTTVDQRATYAALPIDHPLADRRQLALAELVDLPMILLDVPPSREYFLQLFRDKGLKPEIAHTSPSLELVRGMVGQGLGYSILATRPVGDLTYDGLPLAVVPLADTPAASNIVLASPAAMRPTRLMEFFESFAVRHIGSDGPGL